MGFLDGLFGGGSGAPAAGADAGTAGADSTTSAALPPDPGTLDGFASLVRQSEAAEVKAGAGKGKSGEPAFDLRAIGQNPEAFKTLAQDQDFLKDLPPDVMEGLEQGNVKAIMAAIQFTGQQAYARATQHAAALAGTGIDSSKKELPSTIEQQIGLALAKQSRIKEYGDVHPVAHMMLDGIAEKLLALNPQMSPQEAAKASKQLLGQLGGAVTPKPETDTNRWEQAPWDKWASGQG